MRMLPTGSAVAVGASAAAVTRLSAHALANTARTRASRFPTIVILPIRTAVDRKQAHSHSTTSTNFRSRSTGPQPPQPGPRAIQGWSSVSGPSDPEAEHERAGAATVGRRDDQGDLELPHLRKPDPR